jgi:hypothetical protein
MFYSGYHMYYYYTPPVPIVGFKLLTLLATMIREELQSVLVYVYILCLEDQGSLAWSSSIVISVLLLLSFTRSSVIVYQETARDYS